jgi:hypothetical protein
VTKKHLIVFVAMLALVGSACSKGKIYGCDPSDKKCIDASRTVPTSAKPKPKPKKSSPRPTPTVSQPASTPTVKGYEPKTYTIVINNVGDGYEPDQRSLYVSDILVFKNKDSQGYEHSFTVADYQDKNKIYEDSGPIKAGKSWTWHVDLPPGLYEFHDTKVPYLQSGRLNVTAVPK